MMDEQMKPGKYTALGDMNIRAAMKTFPTSNIVGGFKNGENFKVYQIYPEASGILWGRISSSTETGTARYVGLRVNNHPKAKFEKPFETEAPQAPISEKFENRLTDLEAWARTQGYMGPFQH